MAAGRTGTTPALARSLCHRTLSVCLPLQLHPRPPSVSSSPPPLCLWRSFSPPLRGGLGEAAGLCRLLPSRGSGKTDKSERPNCFLMPLPAEQEGWHWESRACVFSFCVCEVWVVGQRSCVCVCVFWWKVLLYLILILQIAHTLFRTSLNYWIIILISWSEKMN